MWSIGELKGKARDSFKLFYFEAVVASFWYIFLCGDNPNEVLKFSLFGKQQNNATGSFITFNLFDLSVVSISDFLTFIRNCVYNRLYYWGIPIKLIDMSWTPYYAAILVVVVILFKIFIINPLILGIYKTFLEGSEGRNDLSNLFWCFSKKANYGNIVKILLIRNIKLFLWSLLLIIPGFIKSYEYRMIPYLLCDNPDIRTEEAFELTRNMTYGDKFYIFTLDLSFIFCFLLCGLLENVLRMDIVFRGLFLIPYLLTTDVFLYKALKSKDNPELSEVYESFTE